MENGVLHLIVRICITIECHSIISLRWNVNSTNDCYQGTTVPAKEMDAFFSDHKIFLLAG